MYFFNLTPARQQDNIVHYAFLIPHAVTGALSRRHSLEKIIKII